MGAAFPVLMPGFAPVFPLPLRHGRDKISRSATGGAPIAVALEREMKKQKRDPGSKFTIGVIQMSFSAKPAENMKAAAARVRRSASTPPACPSTR